MTQVGESVNMSLPGPEDQEKTLAVEVVTIKHKNGYTVANNKAKVNGNNWPAPQYMGQYSSAPIVAKIGEALTLELSVKVESENVSGNGKLLTNFLGLNFEGSIPLSSGTHTVEATLQNPESGLMWYKGNCSWGVEGGGVCVLSGSVFLEMFFVFDDPSAFDFFKSTGVWAEALRYLFTNNSAFARETVPQDAVVKVTQTCFGIRYHKYEITQGEARYGGATGTFELNRYMAPSYGFVNCYDQSYAVTVFCGALGIDVPGLYLRPFGYINTTNLVGWGNCNNPFPSGKFNTVVRSGITGVRPENFLQVGINDPDRSGFGNHMFCEFSGKIFDACAGSYDGVGDRAAYVTAVIDSTTRLAGRRGTASGIVTNASLGGEVKSVS